MGQVDSIFQQGYELGLDTANQRIAELEKRISMLQGVAAQAYQLAGMAGASDKVLDLLSEAANGEDIGDRNFLPIYEDDLEMGVELAVLRKRLVEAEGLLEERLQWDQYWLGDCPEKTLGRDGAFSLEHWQIKSKVFLSPAAGHPIEPTSDSPSPQTL